MDHGDVGNLGVNSARIDWLLWLGRQPLKMIIKDRTVLCGFIYREHHSV